MQRVLVLIAALALAAGCTPEESVAPGPRATAGTPDETPATVSGPVQEEEEADVFAEDAAVLAVAIPEPATLDPMLVQDPGSVLVARQLYEGLTRWDPVAEEVVPAAAESWDVERRGRRFVFHLREGMTFHDGTPVTARDFKFAFDRIARRRSGSDLAYTLERVKGFVEVNQLGDRKRLPGIRVRGPLTLVVVLDEPFQELPAVLTHPGLVPVPRAALRDLDEFVNEPVGNGPFLMMQPWAPGEEVMLGAFEGFWDPTELEGIRFVAFADAAESWLIFRDGRLDVSEVPVGQIEQAAEEFGTDGYLPLLNASYYGINMDRSSLASRRVRKAVSVAIDRSRIASEVFQGNMAPPRGVVPAGMPGFDHDQCRELCLYDPDEAARIVSELPPRKKKIDLEFTRGRPHAQVATAIENDLEAVGFEVRVRSFGFREYLRRLRDSKQGLYRLGWIAEYPTADVFLTSLFRSDSPDNHSGFSSKRVDRLLRRAHRSDEEAERARAYRKAEELILDSLPVVPIGSFEIHWAAQPHVEGLRFDMMGGFDAAGVALADR